jgi:phosphoribosyl-ATP pyrophosphohydrolase
MTLEEMFTLATERLAAGADAGSTGRLLAEGTDAIGKKLVEEAAESWMAARYETTEELALELSQVLYYVTCLAVHHELSLEDLERHL